MSTHISEQPSRLVIRLHNAWCRIIYAKRLGAITALKHRHVFKRWTGARNLLCWCGAVERTQKENTHRGRSWKPLPRKA